MLSKLKTKKSFAKVMFVAILILVPSIVYFVLGTNELSLIVYNFSYNITYVVLTIITYVITFNTTNYVSDIKKNYQLEHLATREAFLSIGRIMSYFLLILASLFNDMYAYEILIAIFSFSFILMNYLVYKIYEK